MKALFDTIWGMGANEFGLTLMGWLAVFYLFYQCHVEISQWRAKRQIAVHYRLQSTNGFQ